MDHTFSRRGCLTAMGTAGVALLGTGDRVDAAVKRFSAADFSYEFRKFRPGEIIKLGMIGTEGHTDMILRDIPSMTDVRLVAWSNRKADESLPKGVKHYAGYSDMLDHEDLHVVGICLPYYLNAKAAVCAAEKGLHVVMEKPVATTLKDLGLLRDAVTKNRVRLTALLGMRLDPPYRAIARCIEDGAIGEPVLVSAQKSYKFGKSRPDFYRNRATYGGTIPWVGIHAIDYIHYTTRLDFFRVAAFQGNACHSDYPGVEDHAGMVFEMTSGRTALLNLDFLRPESAATHGDDRLRVAGTSGVIEIKDGGTRVELIDSKGAHDITLPDAEPFFRNFVYELRGEGTHVLAPEEPFEMTRVALLARESAETGRVIDL